MKGLSAIQLLSFPLVLFSCETQSTQYSTFAPKCYYQNNLHFMGFRMKRSVRFFDRLKFPGSIISSAAVKPLRRKTKGEGYFFRLLFLDGFIEFNSKPSETTVKVQWSPALTVRLVSQCQRKKYYGISSEVHLRKTKGGAILSWNVSPLWCKYVYLAWILLRYVLLIDFLNECDAIERISVRFVSGQQGQLFRTT